MAIPIQSASPNSFPIKIKELAGKEIRLRLEISKDNVEAKSRLFFATDAYDSSISTPTSSSATISDSNMDTTSVTEVSLSFIFQI